MGLMQSVTQSIFLAVCAGTVALTIYSERKNLPFAVDTWKRFRFPMLVETVLATAASISLAATLSLNVPFLGWGLFKLFTGESGNAHVTPAMNLVESPSWESKATGICLVLGLILVFPFLARYEEVSFRKDCLRWPAIARSSLMFGAIHLLVGVPLAVIPSLSAMGFFYAWKYRSAHLRALAKGMSHSEAAEEGLAVSTAYHAMTNTVIVVTATALILIR